MQKLTIAIYLFQYLFIFVNIIKKMLAQVNDMVTLYLDGPF